MRLILCLFDKFFHTVLGCDTISAECEAHRPVLPDAIFVSSADGLACKGIIHAVVNSEPIEEDPLLEFVFRCLKAGKERGYATLSLPATNEFYGLPVDKLCQTVLKAARKYLTVTTNGLCEINIVTDDLDVFNKLEDTMAVSEKEEREGAIDKGWK